MDGLSTVPALIEAFKDFRPGHYRLGELLVSQGFCTSDDIASGLKHQPHDDRHLGDILIRLGICTRQQIAETLNLQAIASDPLWDKLGRLSWHPDARLSRQESGMIVGVPRLGSYFRFTATEFQLLETILAAASYPDVLETAWAEFQILVTPEQVLALGHQLFRTGVIYDQASEPESLPRAIRLRLPLFDPDPLLEKLMPLLVRVASRSFLLFVWLPLVILACGIAVSRPQAIALALTLTWPHLLETYLAIALVVFVHEAGHAAIARALGAPVHEIGIMFYGGLPLGYANVSSAHLLERKRDRIAVSLGGLYFQLAFSSLALLCWAWLPMSKHGHAIALNLALLSGGSILFDLNPFARMDGYYVLSDWLAIPNLRSRAFSYVIQRLRGKPVEPLERWQRSFFWCYGIASVLMTLVLAALAFWGWIWLIGHYR